MQAALDRLRDGKETSLENTATHFSVKTARGPTTRQHVSRREAFSKKLSELSTRSMAQR